jgi:hypothetical protein
MPPLAGPLPTVADIGLRGARSVRDTLDELTLSALYVGLRWGTLLLGAVGGRR